MLNPTEIILKDEGGIIGTSYIKRFFLNLLKNMEEKWQKLFTSESVTEGHPDKLVIRFQTDIRCSIRKDPYGRVAVETVATTGLLVLVVRDDY